MDTSKEYIKMCEKAVEVQDIWQVTAGDFVKICEVSSVLIAGFQINFYEARRKTNIWLPRQDQLQDMLIGVVDSNESGVCKLNGLNNQIVCFGRFYHRDSEYSGNFISMEQLWLAFVMKEKYNKTWNGKNWIKEK